MLERLIANGKTPQKLAVRARIVLLSGRGLGTMAIARETRVSKPTIWRWQEAYMEGGVERLRKDKGKGPKAGKPRISDAVRLRIVTMTAEEKPANATHWSARMLAKQAGVGHTTVQRVWKEYGLKPHLTRSFKLSNDPQFAEKVRDIVGLYLDPPDNALVLSVDEKSQIQALDRTQPGLPMKKGRAGTMTHDYKRNGVTTLFAALIAAKAKSVTLDATVARPLDVHVICDNYRTHKTKEVQAWLAKHPRFRMHYTPPPRPGLISWSGCSPKSPASKSGAALSKALRTSKPPSTPGSPGGMPNQHPSKGPLRPATSWKRMPARERFWPAYTAVLNE